MLCEMGKTFAKMTHRQKKVLLRQLEIPICLNKNFGMLIQSPAAAPAPSRAGMHVASIDHDDIYSVDASVVDPLFAKKGA